MHIANIGDTECYLFDYEKISYPLIYKHKATDENEKQRILFFLLIIINIKKERQAVKFKVIELIIY